ncbi:MAG: hypothetical protein M1142_05220 [Patescibacteria group bacterium]|nr:hypothetical protein [Patescibacteria group bacterium]
MNRKNGLFLLVLVCILLVALEVVTTNKPPDYKKGVSSEADRAGASAVTLYKKRVTEGLDVSKAPCLTNDLMPGWVVDIVHAPRETSDDVPANQCQAFIEGRATHFVELDINGNLVRIK